MKEVYYQKKFSQLYKRKKETHMVSFKIYKSLTSTRNSLKIYTTADTGSNMARYYYNKAEYCSGKLIIAEYAKNTRLVCWLMNVFKNNCFYLNKIFIFIKMKIYHTVFIAFAVLFDTNWRISMFPKLNEWLRCCIRLFKIL